MGFAFSTEGFAVSTQVKRIVLYISVLLLVAAAVATGIAYSDTGFDAANIKTSTVPTGEYHQTANGVNGAFMSAVVSDGKIEVTLKLDSGEEGDSDATGTYWVGSFDRSKAPTIVSDADLKDLNTSMFGSQDDTKTFTYDHGDLSFPFEMLGIKTTVHLTK